MHNTRMGSELGAFSHADSELQFEMEHLEKLATSIRDISINFTSLVAKICDEIPLAEC